MLNVTERLFFGSESRVYNEATKVKTEKLKNGKKEFFNKNRNLGKKKRSCEEEKRLYFSHEDGYSQH